MHIGGDRGNLENRLFSNIFTEERKVYHLEQKTIKFYNLFGQQISSKLFIKKKVHIKLKRTSIEDVIMKLLSKFKIDPCNVVQVIRPSS